MPVKYLFLLVFCCGLCCTAFGQVPQGFKPLFNGRNLKGWHISRTTHQGTTPDVRVEAGATRILLDNMSSETMRRAVAITAGRATLEASGGLTLERAREVGETGVDFVSVGALTHSVRVFDIGFDLDEVPFAGHSTRADRSLSIKISRLFDFLN